MIDINTILNSAINAAVDAAVAPLVKRIEALENIVAEFTPSVAIDEARMIEALNSQEWFWEKINTYARGSVALSVEAAMDNHVELYNHDDYDEAVSKIEDVDFDEIPDNETIEDTIKQVLNNAALRIRF